jgi:hypothetical protein
MLSSINIFSVYAAIELVPYQSYFTVCWMDWQFDNNKTIIIKIRSWQRTLIRRDKYVESRI